MRLTNVQSGATGHYSIFNCFIASETTINSFSNLLGSIEWRIRRFKCRLCNDDIGVRHHLQ